MVRLSARRTSPDERPELADSRTCEVALVDASTRGPTLRLSLVLAAPVAGAETMVEMRGFSARPLETARDANTWTALIPGAGRYGVTRERRPWSSGRTAGAGRDETTTDAGWFRNITSRGIDAGAFDGRRLFVGSGPRILIFDGMPGPFDRPINVLGQPDLVSNVSGVSSALVGGRVRSIWSDGTMVAAAVGNRILLWRALPESDFTPADLVLGQADFGSDEANGGGVDAHTLSAPTQIAFDGSKVAVADSRNHRVLWWDGWPSRNGAPADGVIGQPDFTSRNPGSGAAPLSQPWGVVLRGPIALVTSLFSFGVVEVSISAGRNPASTTLVPARREVSRQSLAMPAMAAITETGRLAVRDEQGERVAVYRQWPAAGDEVDWVLGQASARRSVSAWESASTLTAGTQVAAGAGWLLVPDRSRLLAYREDDHFDGAPARHVVGQPGFSTSSATADYRSIGAATLAFPADVAADGELLTIADRANNRVMVYSRRDEAPLFGLGQMGPNRFVANGDLSSPARNTMSGPASVAMAGGVVVVADTDNHRVLVFRDLPTDWGEPADVILCQSHAQAIEPNRGLGDADMDSEIDVDRGGCFEPTGVDTDGNRIVVADRMNNRVLVWNTLPTADGALPDGVLGQVSFDRREINRGRGPWSPSPDGFDLPSAVRLDGEDGVYVADTENNRVVLWRLDGAAPSPVRFFGQSDGHSLSNPNSAPPGRPLAGVPAVASPTGSSLIQPRGLALVGGRLAVAEYGANRVHFFDTETGATSAILGQHSEDEALVNAGGLGAGSLASPAGLNIVGDDLYVADTGNHRIVRLRVDSLPHGSAKLVAAQSVIGQPSFLNNGFNGSSEASGFALSDPGGCGTEGNTLFIADSGHNRVLFVDDPFDGGEPSVLGQLDGTLALPNRGGTTKRDGLASPRDVSVSSQWIAVADTANNRVVLYDRSASSTVGATIVLGQRNGEMSEPDRGGLAGADTLDGPRGVFISDARLMVADTENHRVLIWSRLPTRDGEPADLVLGQEDDRGTTINRGHDLPGSTTLAFPSDVFETGSHLVVADTGNNRVLLFPLAVEDGMPAEVVLGQPSFQSRRPAAAVEDTTHLSGPVAVSSDGVSLFVAERDLSRILQFQLDALPGSVVTDVVAGSARSIVSRPGGVAVFLAPLYTTRLLVTEGGNDRLIEIEGLTRLSPP